MQKTQIALFPLQIFLLPGETTTLHIFEERYRQLLEDCENIHISFGIPYTPNGYISEFGCVVELNKVIRRHSNGSTDIEIIARDVFRVDQFYTRMGEKLYPGGDVVMLNSNELPTLSRNVLKYLESYIKEYQPSKFAQLLDASLNAYDAARILGLSEADKIKLVKSKSEEKRERVLIQNIQFLEALAKQSKSVVGEIFLN